MVDQPDVDTVAASLRADRAEAGVFLEVLAGKLADALPDATQVTRTGGRFGRARHVERIEVDIGERAFVLGRERASLRAEVEHRVRGVRLSGTEVDVDEWLRALAAALTEAAASESRAREALGRLLG